MPEFILNTPARKHAFDSLDEFARGYVEAMFFTNCDSGHENEFIANELGVERLTRASVATIKAQCDAFQAQAAELLKQAYERGDYDAEQAGRDFWFTRQGHGVGFWDRDQLDGTLGDKLSAAARSFGESYVEIYRGWIYAH